MRALTRKLFRDVLHMWGQALAIALVVACGVATFVLSLSTYHSLGGTRDDYYEDYRFADVFVQAKRAPEPAGIWKRAFDFAATLMLPVPDRVA